MRRAAAILGTIVFFFIAPFTVAGLMPWWITGRDFGSVTLAWSAHQIAGGALIAAGYLVLLACFARFALEGIGTPAPVFPTQHLVINGMYRYVRNPMYVGLLIVILGQGLILEDWRVFLYGACVWLAVHAFVLGYEEPKLRATYGAEYAAFQRAVPRWIPRVSPWNNQTS